jgi:hypothetical protein
MANIELDGANKKIKVDSGDLTLDVPGDIILDADGGDVVVADGGTNILKVTNSSSDVVLQPQVDAKDIIFKQYDGTTVATVEDNGTFNIPANKLAIGGTAVTSTAAELNIMDGVTSTAAELNILDGVTSTTAELNILDGVTATAAEINLIDGGTARGTTAIADGDGVLINDAGTMRMTSVETLKTYIGGGDNTPIFRAYQNSAQSISASSYTIVNFQAENFDPDSTFNVSNGRFTPAVAGYYYIHAGVRINTSDDMVTLACNIRKNAGAIIRHTSVSQNYGNSQASILVYSDTDDYFDVEVYKDAGGSHNLSANSDDTFFEAFKVIT